MLDTLGTVIIFSGLVCLTTLLVGLASLGGLKTWKTGVIALFSASGIAGIICVVSIGLLFHGFSQLGP